MEVRKNIIFIIAIIMANMGFSEDCYPPVDTNWDGALDVLDIVVTVNSAFGPGFNGGGMYFGISTGSCSE